ncbi:MAG: hypothetical protein V4517_15225 [Pseudomonadota bacterium]
MEIRPASRPYLLFLILLNVLVLAGCIAAVVFVGFSAVANSLLAGLFVIAGLYVLGSAMMFAKAHIQQPYFRIGISPGQLVVKSRGQELQISSSNVAEYNIYNNKVVLRMHAPVGGGDVAPYAKVREQSVTIYVYLLRDVAELLRGLREFDGSFSDKTRINAGMVIQALGWGVS